MCTYSMVSGHYGDWTPWNPGGTTAPSPFIPAADPINPGDCPGIAPPKMDWPNAAPVTLPWTQESFELLKEVLEKVKKLDDKLGLADCEDPRKAEWMKSIEERLALVEMKHPNAITEFKDEYRFLSNFDQTSTILYDFMSYRSVEHAYQAAKTLNLEERKKIKACETPGKAKRMGQTVTLRADWEEIKLDVMRDLLYKKFSLHPLREKLLATGTKELVEGNNWGDTYWGVCNGKGENRLGIILMDIRADLEGV
jgi:N-glycosidase YbiA